MAISERDFWEMPQEKYKVIIKLFPITLLQTFFWTKTVLLAFLIGLPIQQAAIQYSC